MNFDTVLDKGKVRRSFAAAAVSYDNAAALQRQVGLQLLQKFPVSTMPGVVMDIGCGTGFLTRQLANNCQDNQAVLAMDIALPMLQIQRLHSAPTPIGLICADAEHLPFATDSIRQLYSNLALQWCQNLQAVFDNCQRVLNTGGQFVFATFGPETLKELKAAWQTVDNYTHVNEFYGSEQIATFLLQAGFRQIQIESVLYRSPYASVMALMQELKELGAHNVNQLRNRKPTSKQQLQKMMVNYEKDPVTQEIYASYEVIFVKAVAIS